MPGESQPSFTSLLTLFLSRDSAFWVLSFTSLFTSATFSLLHMLHPHLPFFRHLRMSSSFPFQNIPSNCSLAFFQVVPSSLLGLTGSSSEKLLDLISVGPHAPGSFLSACWGLFVTDNLFYNFCVCLSHWPLNSVGKGGICFVHHLRLVYNVWYIEETINIEGEREK